MVSLLTDIKSNNTTKLLFFTLLFPEKCQIISTKYTKQTAFSAVYFVYKKNIYTLLTLIIKIKTFMDHF